MGKYRQEIWLNKNLHFINFDNGFGQWQLKLQPKFVVGLKKTKPISTKIFFNKLLLQTFVYIEIRFMPFKMACRSWKRWVVINRLTWRTSTQSQAKSQPAFPQYPFLHLFFSQKGHHAFYFSNPLCLVTFKKCTRSIYLLLFVQFSMLCYNLCSKLSSLYWIDFSTFESLLLVLWKQNLSNHARIFWDTFNQIW